QAAEERHDIHVRPHPPPRQGATYRLAAPPKSMTGLCMSAPAAASPRRRLGLGFRPAARAATSEDPRETGAHEVRHLLRAATASSVGARQRIRALPERPFAARARRHARLRLCLGGGAPFPGGVLSLLRARGVPVG